MNKLAQNRLAQNGLPIVVSVQPNGPVEEIHFEENACLVSYGEKRGGVTANYDNILEIVEDKQSFSSALFSTSSDPKSRTRYCEDYLGM